MVAPEELAECEADIAALLARVEQLEAQAVLDREDIRTLHLALDSSRVIGAAIGIVMVALKVRQQEAFVVLRDASQMSNRKLRAVASEVVETGVVPNAPEPAFSSDTRSG